MISSIFGAVFSLEAVYVLTGVTLFIFALMTFLDHSNPRRLGSGCFWLTLGIIFVFGGVAPYWLTGLLVLFLIALDGFGQVSRGSAETNSVEQAEHARRLGNRIFIPAL